ncbi:hypothetical protein VS883_28615, partial [Escherichia coli]
MSKAAIWKRQRRYWKKELSGLAGETASADYAVPEPLLRLVCPKRRFGNGREGTGKKNFLAWQ